MREALGDGYTEALRKVYKKVPKSSDYVMYWWYMAALMLQQDRLIQFGLITTNSIHQAFGRQIIESFQNSSPEISLIFTIPDHPWVDSHDGADVRIAMTVAAKKNQHGTLQTVVSEKETGEDSVSITFSTQKGKIHSNLRIGADISSTTKLKSNANLSCRGVVPHGKGFVVTVEQAQKLGYGSNPDLDLHIKRYFNGRDITQNPRDVLLIDLFGLEIDEVKKKYPEVYQWVYERVKPERDVNPRESRRKNWWIFGEPVPSWREMSRDISRFISTSRTSKHRTFVFLDSDILPDYNLVNIALEDPYFLGVLSSKIHVSWALATGGRLGVGNDPIYNNTACFDKFPFPDASEAQKAHIHALAEQLDAHRKRQQAQHPSLTLTDMYNVLEKVRALETNQTSKVSETFEVFSAKEKQIYEQGLIAILKQLHDDLDAAVFAAYGWPPSLTDEEILQHLVDLNAERAAEEANGRVRWLRPTYQAPNEVQPQQQTLLDVPTTPEVTTPAEKLDWPKALKDRATAVRTILAGFGCPVSVEQVAEGFNGRRTPKRLDEVGEILEMLAELGQIVEREGKFATQT